MDVSAAERYILDLLERELSETLFYHGLHHVLDVRDAALILAKEEGVVEEESLELLRTAALYHDSGFLRTYKDHEEEGCRIAQAILPGFGYSAQQTGQVCGMIMATKIPQSPQNHLEQILCDADLDYLGRSDFEPIAQTLFQELWERNLITDQKTWDQVQVKFIAAHQYHTTAGRLKREALKQEHLRKLNHLISNL
jgi:uncharacterized protein